MALAFKTGWLDGVRHVRSPNCDHRPPTTVVDTVVIHGISLPPGSFGGSNIEALFCNRLDASGHPYFQQICDLRVSAHFLVDRGGEITQFVSVDDRAWHAGVSFFCGRTRVNDFSIGIELEGTDERPYASGQYLALAGLLNNLLAHNPALSIERICGHSDIASGRKTDPGGSFDWPRLRRLLVQQLCNRTEPSTDDN